MSWVNATHLCERYPPRDPMLPSVGARPSNRCRPSSRGSDLACGANLEVLILAPRSRGLTIAAAQHVRGHRDALTSHLQGIQFRCQSFYGRGRRARRAQSARTGAGTSRAWDGYRDAAPSQRYLTEIPGRIKCSSGRSRGAHRSCAGGTATPGEVPSLSGLSAKSELGNRASSKRSIPLFLQ